MDNLEQRLAAIEAALPTLATKADLEGIETELHKLTELVTDELAEARKARDETRYVTGLMGGMSLAGASLADYVRALAERVEHLERRGE